MKTKSSDWRLKRVQKRTANPLVASRGASHDDDYKQGPVGALMDEYERAAGELARILEAISDEDYTLIRTRRGQSREYACVPFDAPMSAC